MALALTVLTYTAMLAAVCIIKKKRPAEALRSDYAVIILTGLLFRFAASFITSGFPTDIKCWKDWGEALASGGFGSFYTGGAGGDYPPGYMYVLFALAKLKNLLGIGIDSSAYVYLLKLPAIICDVALAYFAYYISEKKLGRLKSLFIAFLLILSPAVIMDSAVWGQVDSVVTLILVVSIYLLSEKKMLGSVLLFMAAIIVKPQALIASPVFLFDFYRYLREEQFSAASFLRLAKYGLCCLALGAALCLPFAATPQGFTYIPVLKQFASTLASYPYVSVNAYNIYTLFGLNWVDVNSTLLFIPYSAFGALAILAVTAASLFLLHKSPKKSTYFLSAALLYFAMFMFSTKMHERYSFPALVFLLFSFIYSQNKRTLVSYIAVSAAFFLNCADILRLYVAGGGLDAIFVSSRLISAMYVIAFGIFAYNCVSEVEDVVEECGGETEAPIHPEALDNEIDNKPAASGEPRMRRPDSVIMAALTIVYAVISFVNLGDVRAAESDYKFSFEPVIIDLGAEQTVTRLQYYLGKDHDKDMVLAFSSDGVNYGGELEFTAEYVFRWDELYVNETARYVRISASSWDTYFIELGLRGENGELVTPVSVSAGAEALFDEQALVPDKSTYMNSTYFDEIYHARTAYEFLNKGGYIYEWTHPPLGKLLISLGINAFGMNPFGWRFTGNLFGIMMIPLVYIFAKRVFKNTFWASAVTLLFTFDFMHFAQTRIATIDTYITFFVIAMYYFMYLFFEAGYNTLSFKRTLLPLFASGLCMGLGIACKWPGIYAGAGLGVIFFWALASKHIAYIRDRHNNTQLISTRLYYRHFVTTLLCCVLFFVVIPAVIYLLSYYPYYQNANLVATNAQGLAELRQNPLLAALFPENGWGTYLGSVAREQLRVFEYHATLVSTHPYSSSWWQWPIIYKPIWYYSGEISATVRMGISSFGNPAVWWAGIPAFFFTVWRAASRKDKLALFLILGYLAQYLPWMLVERTTYIYHYFPSVIFIALMIVYSLGFLDIKKRYRLILGYLIAVVALFCLFYPVLSGLPMNVSFVYAFLRWFSQWVLI